MPIATSCPNCLTKYTLADNQLDKTVRCRTCQRPFLVSEDVPAGETYKRPGSGERPRLRDADRGRDDRDYDDRDRRDRDYDDRRRDRPSDDPRDRARRRARGGIPVVVWLMIAAGATVVVITGAVVLLLVLGSLGGRASVANYNRLRTGMTEAEVVAILGRPDEVQDQGGIGVGGIGGMKLMGWKSGNNKIAVVMVNGRLTGKFFESPTMKMNESGLPGR